MNKLGKILSAFGLLTCCSIIAGVVPAEVPLGPFSNTVAAAEAITSNDILLNDKHIDVGKIKEIRNTTYVPLKPLVTSMGYTLSWNAGTKQATVLRPGRTVTLKSGSTDVVINGTASKLTLPPQIYAGTLYVPLVTGVQALGGSVRKEMSELYITDKTRYVQAALKGSSYWVSQADGKLYVRLNGQAVPKLVGQLDLKVSPYLHSLTATAAGPNAVLLELKDQHYAMFTDFENRYQALLHGDTLVKHTAYHNMTTAYLAAPVPASTQLYLTDGHTVQYILQDGSLGAPLDFTKLTGQELTVGFRVEYAAPDILLARASTTQLYAINPATGDIMDLSAKLIAEADQEAWNHASGSDPYELTRMLRLTKREGNTLTFVYSPLTGGAAVKKTYDLPKP